MVSKTASAISVLSYPKVNLTLDILNRDSVSGYREIQTVFHELRGYPNTPVDEIIIQNAEASGAKAGEIEVACDNPCVPCGKTNTVFKAALLLKRYLLRENFDIPCGAKIFIKKRIPLMSGLGGGASNAVSALKSLAKFWGVKCCKFAAQSQAQQPQKEAQKTGGQMTGARKQKDGKLHGELHATGCILRNLAQQVGMDCSFFFDGGTALGEHFGEKITQLPVLPSEIKFEIIKTGIEVSSHEAYKWVDLARCGKNQHKTKGLIRALRAQDTKGILENLHNDFEEAVFERYPGLLQKKCEMETKIDARFARVLLCGSGGCLVKIGLKQALILTHSSCGF